MKERILVAQTWGIGDMIMTTPALRALRRARPRARIGVLAGSAAAAAVVAPGELCDELHLLPARAVGRLARLAAIRALAGRYDAALCATQLNPGLPALLRLLARIPVVAADGGSWLGSAATHWRPVLAREHRTRANLELLRLIAPDCRESPQVEMAVDAESRRLADELWASSGLESSKTLGVHPGGGSGQWRKRPPVPLVRELIGRWLAQGPDFAAAVFRGPEDPAVTAELVGESARVRIFERQPIRVAAALISRVAAFVAGDSGLGHVAAAVGVPVLTLGGPTDVRRTRPWGKRADLLLTTEPLACMPCHGSALFETCPHVACMNTISPEAASAALERVAREGRPA